MRLGIDVAQQRLEFGEIVDRVRFGEELGFDGAWGFDHFRPMYGRGPGNCFEGMTTLAALAGRTNRIRLGLLVAGVTYRHPSIIAAEAVTIDHASNGRLELGVGAAWYEAEHRQLGLDFPPVGERFDRLEDQLEIFVRLFTGDVVSYQGHQVSLDDAQLLPMPVQRPGPPIWIGGSGPKRTLPLVAKFGDMWHTDSLADYGQLSARVDDLATAAGRDPTAIGRAASLSLSAPWDEVRRNVETRRNLGIDYLVCSWPSEGRRRVEEFWTTVAPDLAD
ncbi:MAG TPA: LLM class flavin-dependent oxidoreductase [Jiangellaceae bacterium]|jgi:alkanesulfonate monooxygenase SsuD/methylene tetrahydromethanopterin reductase-like flavin-dependent oxidoreductase (luciferase family)|nr:LLM class flavin-dependent oxidoreductase [Jiangellaceae bacterium]